jgi:hypothetical protein
MTTSSEDSVKLEAKTITPPRHSHHKSRRRKRIAARILFILGFVVGVLAGSDFAYNAYRGANCYPAQEIMVGGVTIIPPEREECSAEVARRDELLQVDGTAAMVAVAFLITSTLISRRIKRHRRLTMGNRLLG